VVLQPAGRWLALLICVAWFVVARQWVEYLLGSGLDVYADTATRLHYAHVDVVWTGVLVGIAVAGLASGLVGRSRAAVIVAGCLVVVSLFAMAVAGTNDSGLQQEQPPTSPATPTWTHCAIYSGGTNNCPGG
jgi:hypothetical protein